MFWFLLDGLEEIRRDLCDEAHLVYSSGKPVGGTQLIHGIRYELGKWTPAASSNNSNPSFQASPVWVISISSGFRLHQQNLLTETVGNGGPLPVCQVVMVWLFSLPILFINVQCSEPNSILFILSDTSIQAFMHFMMTASWVLFYLLLSNNPNQMSPHY